jgi:exonuclease III
MKSPILSRSHGKRLDNKLDLYTWWDPKTFMRSVNRGWRLDYAIVSSTFADQIEDAGIITYVLFKRPNNPHKFPTRK